MSVCSPSYPSIQPQPAHGGWGDNNYVAKAEWRFSREAGLPTEQTGWGGGISASISVGTLEVCKQTKLPVPDGPSAQKTV